MNRADRMTFFGGTEGAIPTTGRSRRSRANGSPFATAINRHRQPPPGPGLRRQKGMARTRLPNGAALLSWAESEGRPGAGRRRGPAHRQRGPA